MLTAYDIIDVPMNRTQQALLQLSQKQDLSRLSLRETGKLIGVDHPQAVKYHLSKLQKSGLLKMQPTSSGNKVDRNILGKSVLVTIPIVGAANCGPATMLAEERVEGYLKISSSLLQTKNYKSLYALRASGISMDRANIDGKPVRDGDYVIIDGTRRNPQNGEYVVAVVDGLANIKKFYKDSTQVVLLSESSDDYLPIFIHPDDEQEGMIGGIVVQVINNPQQ